MEKLIELLNEYRKEKGERNLNEFEVSQTLDSLNYLRLFIKWLVENDKIDLELDSIIHKHKWIDFNTWKWIVLEKLCNKYESLLMLLSISDEPIRFLCEIIK